MPHPRWPSWLGWLPLALVIAVSAGCAGNAASLNRPAPPSDPPSASEAPVAAPASPSTSPGASPAPSRTAAPAPAQAAVVDRTLQRATDRVDVTITYPQLRGLADPGVQDRINEAIRRDVEGRVPASDPAPLPPAFAPRTYGVRGSYQLFRLDGQVVSLLQSLTMSPPTAAHPSTRYQAYNFDLSTGEPIALRSLFKPDTPWLETLSRESPSLISQDVDRRHGWPVDEASLLKQGYAPTEKNFEAFTLPPEGLRVTFQEYQVGAYALGSPTMVLPWDHLAPFLADTPLARHLVGRAG